jgi:AAA+ superfamily predicted ATPase
MRQFRSEVENLIKARYPYIAISTFDERLCIENLTQICKERQSQLFVWSRAAGVQSNNQPLSDIRDPLKVLEWYEEQTQVSILVLLDFEPFCKDHGVARKIRDLSTSLKNSRKNIIFVSPAWESTPTLRKEIHCLTMPLPTQEDILGLLNEIAEYTNLNQINKDDICSAALGLCKEEIENVFAKCLVSVGCLDRKIIQEEKKQIVKQTGILEFIDVPATLEVGGMDNLKSWLRVRKDGLLKPPAHMPHPKGIMLVGIPGCGKSLSARFISYEWQLPLLRLDVGRIFSGLVGSSEQNLRSVLQTAEAVSPCILWIDEIEKAFAQGGGQDGGTSSRVFGSLLTWMQEKKKPVFVFATANSIEKLPPEFLRKGRFDEIFFVDLPSHKERQEICKIICEKFRLQLQIPDRFVTDSEGYSGSEIEEVFIDAAYDAHSQGVSMSAEHLGTSLKRVIPLSTTMKNEMKHLRDWARSRARYATHQCTKEPSNTRIERLEIKETTHDQ